MQKVLDLKVIGKASMPLLALLGISIGITPEGASADIVQAAMFLAGMIGIAAVMRSDVSRLKKWQEKHEDTHQKIAESNETIAKILGRLEEAKKDADRRFRALETHVYNRRVGDPGED